MASIFLASGNLKKLAEMQQVLYDAELHDVVLSNIKQHPEYIEPVENGANFQENALIKARAGAQLTGRTCIADDSGLAIDALNGMPGMFSARWAGLEADRPREQKDIANRDLVLKQIADVPESRRGAHFVSVCALVTRHGKEFVCEGIWPGSIALTARGEGGFGYDPIFLPENMPGVTAAEIPPEQKNTISHRARALHKVAELLRELAQNQEL